MTKTPLIQLSEQAIALLQSIASEIDEFYEKSHVDDSTGETEELFGPFITFQEVADGDFALRDDHGDIYASWPNLKCLRDDIRKFLGE